MLGLVRIWSLRRLVFLLSVTAFSFFYTVPYLTTAAPRGPKRGVATTPAQQLGVGTDFNEPSALHHRHAVALAAAFKSSLLESVEIAVVVVGFGAAGGGWFESIGGALLAAVGLVLFAVLLQAPLARVAIKATKFFASMLLMGFGTYWLGEGDGLRVADRRVVGALASASVGSRHGGRRGDPSLEAHGQH